MSSTSASSPALLEDVKKDAEIWFEDGNIVLVAGNTAFRLYRGLLTSASPIFGDMFSISHPEDGETIDGCPVVRLPDSPSDLRHFLRMLVKPEFNLLRRNVKLPFGMVSAIARIGHKYEIQEALNAAADRLVDFFTGLYDTLRKRSEAMCSWDKLWEAHQESRSLTVGLEDGVEAVNVARLLGRIEMIPLALYLCCVGEPLHLRNGVRRGDGVVERLSDEDYLRCVRAGPGMLRRCNDSVKVALDCSGNPMEGAGIGRPFDGCHRPGGTGACKGVVAEMYAANKGKLIFGAYTEMLIHLDGKTPVPGAYKERREKLCPKCRAYLLSRSRVAAQGGWIETVEWFAASITADVEGS